MSVLGPTRWAVLASSMAVGALVAVVLDLSSPLRALLVLGFVLFVPGISVVRLLGFDELAVNVALGCALSIALAGSVAGVLIVAEWSSTLGLAFLVLVAVGAATLELARTKRSDEMDDGGLRHVSFVRQEIAASTLRAPGSRRSEP